MASVTPEILTLCSLGREDDWFSRGRVITPREAGDEYNSSVVKGREGEGKEGLKLQTVTLVAEKPCFLYLSSKETIGRGPLSSSPSPSIPGAGLSQQRVYLQQSSAEMAFKTFKIATNLDDYTLVFSPDHRTSRTIAPHSVTIRTKDLVENIWLPLEELRERLSSPREEEEERSPDLVEVSRSSRSICCPIFERKTSK